MYCLSQFCFLCLNKETNLLSINSFDNDKKTIRDKLCYTINNIVFPHSGYDTKICKFCYDILRVAHEFKRKCSENNKILLGYVNKLTEQSAVYGNASVVLEKLSEKSEDNLELIIDLIQIQDETEVSEHTLNPVVSPKFKQEILTKHSPVENIALNRDSDVFSTNKQTKIYVKEEYKLLDGKNYKPKSNEQPNISHKQKLVENNILPLKNINSTELKLLLAAPPLHKPEFGNIETYDLNWLENEASCKKIEQTIMKPYEPEVNNVETNQNLKIPTISKAPTVVDIEEFTKSVMVPAEIDILELETEMLLNRHRRETYEEIEETKQTNTELKNSPKKCVNKNNNLKAKTDSFDADANSSYFANNEESSSSFDFVEENIFSEEERKNYELMREDILKNTEIKEEVIEIHESPSKKPKTTQNEDYITSVLLNLSKSAQKLEENKTEKILVANNEILQTKQKKLQTKRQPLPKIKKPGRNNKKVIANTSNLIEIDSKRQHLPKIRKINNKIIVNDRLEVGSKFQPVLKNKKTGINANETEEVESEDDINPDINELDNSTSNMIDDPQIVVNLLPQIPDPIVGTTAVDSEDEDLQLKNLLPNTNDPMEIGEPVNPTEMYNLTSNKDPYSDPVFVLELDHSYTMKPNKFVATTNINRRKRKHKPFTRRKMPLEYVQKKRKKPFPGRLQCNICYFKASNQDELDEHLINEHQGHEFYGCNFCPRKYTTFFSLKRHCKAIHKMSIAINNANNFETYNEAEEITEKCAE